MIDEHHVLDGLRQIFADVFLRDDIPVGRALTAADVEGWDSFRQVEIIMAVEQHFHMRFKSTEVDSFRSLGDMMDIIAARGQ